jgi:hypothetical protein
MALVLPSSPLKAVWRFGEEGSGEVAGGKPPKAAAGTSSWSKTGRTIL